ncbi:hypothetical protein BC833DRAFT_606624 [Globomyces pollinis-pini]|nr:hypothetical protein BC833DRAFT_606624 [Globomyces pollinis-pini]
MSRIFQIEMVACSLTRNIALILATIFIITLNSQVACLYQRKIQYILNYVSAIIYDRYQVYKVNQITGGGGGLKFQLLQFLLVVRLGILIYNVFTVQGVLSSANSAGVGSCVTLFPQLSIDLEHAINIILKFAIVFRMIWYVRENYVHGTQGGSIAALFTKLLNFEGFLFAMSFLAEIGYYVVLALIPKSYLSCLLTVYNSLPFIFFWANCLALLIWKKNKNRPSSDKQSNNNFVNFVANVGHTKSSKGLVNPTTKKSASVKSHRKSMDVPRANPQEPSIPE